MALKPPKATTPPEAVVHCDLESAIADELLNDIDWGKVRTALIRKAKQKFISMFIGNLSDRPVVISQYPELAVLPSSSDDEDKAND